MNTHTLTLGVCWNDNIWKRTLCLIKRWARTWENSITIKYIYSSRDIDLYHVIHLKVSSQGPKPSAARAKRPRSKHIHSGRNWSYFLTGSDQSIWSFSWRVQPPQFENWKPFSFARLKHSTIRACPAPSIGSANEKPAVPWGTFTPQGVEHLSGLS